MYYKYLKRFLVVSDIAPLELLLSKDGFEGILRLTSVLGFTTGLVVASLVGGNSTVFGTLILSGTNFGGSLRMYSVAIKFGKLLFRATPPIPTIEADVNPNGFLGLGLVGLIATVSCLGGWGG